MARIMNAATLAIASFGAVATAAAGEYSPYLPAPGGGHVSIEYVRQNATGLRRPTALVRPWNQLVQQTGLISGTYGVNDRLAVDARIGYSESTFRRRPSDRLVRETGVTDGAIGFRYRLMDEFTGAPVTLTLGASGIIAGRYTSSVVNGLGDGASGGQFGLAAGRMLTSKLGVTGVVGYRDRMEDVPAEVFYSAGTSYALHSRVSVYAAGIFANASTGRDLGQPGASGVNFPLLEEESNLWTTGASIGLTDKLSLSGAYGEKFEGRNTTNGPFFRIGLSHAF